MCGDCIVDLNTNGCKWIVSTKSCGTCNGTGSVKSQSRCSACMGTAEVKHVVCDGSGSVNCNGCSGQGSLLCGSCNGAGTTTKLHNCIHGRGPNSSHYYCSGHGSSVSQYH